MNARDMSPIEVGKVLPNHHRAFVPVLEPARAMPDYTAMDDTAAYAITNARRDQLSDEQIEQLTDEADMAASAERLTDVQHDMRVEWQHALDNQHLPATPKLPTVVGGKLVLVPVTELVGTLMETRRAVQLLCDALRTGHLDSLHLQLRTDWIDGNAQELADMGWTA
jgi:hypothetical protein